MTSFWRQNVCGCFPRKNSSRPLNSVSQSKPEQSRERSASQRPYIRKNSSQPLNSVSQSKPKQSRGKSASQGPSIRKNSSQPLNSVSQSKPKQSKERSASQGPSIRKNSSQPLNSVSQSKPEQSRERSASQRLSLRKKSSQPLNFVSQSKPKQSRERSTSQRPSIRVKLSKWQILIHRGTKVGLVPVDSSHVHYRLLTCVREGLRKVVVEKPLVAKNVLTTEDFLTVSRSNITVDGQKFEFESYAGAVFATLRQSIGIDEQHYLTTVTLSSEPYLQFKSNSNSGQIFFFSHNVEFIFKSNLYRDVTFFLDILPKYLEHFVCYPHSLLVKYVGCYSIKMEGATKKYFLAMQSIFYPASRIQDRFDIKGCLAGRFQDEMEDPDCPNLNILKDKNFFNEHLDFGSQGEWFIKQISIDSQFLLSLNCIDYSLLIGRQRKHLDETGSDTIFTLLNRAGKSICPIKKSNTGPAITDNDHNVPDLTSINLEGMGTKLSVNCKLGGTSSQLDHDSSDTRKKMSINRKHDGTSSQLDHDVCDTTSKATSSSTVILPSVKPGVMFPRNLEDGVEKFQKEHRRLLLKCQNSLHVIDGKELRYFLGIVDFFTRFDWRQKIGQYWKYVIHRNCDHSTKPPDVYQQRFVSFLRDRVK